VVDAVERYLGERSLIEPNNYRVMEPVIGRTLERLAALIGADVARVEFTPNTSYGINILAQGLDWKEGDRVAVPDCEFPANVMPWKGLRGRGVEVDLIPTHRGTFAVEDVERALRPETRVLAVSWVQFLSGFRCDLRALGDLCRSRGVILAVDAIQGLGALRLDVRETPVDFLACGAQKWLMGLPGTGFFYVTEELQERLTPMWGWLNKPVDFDDLLDYSTELHGDARRFRLGTLDMVGITALDAALGLYMEMGIDEAQRQIHMLSRLAADGLAALGLERFGSADPAHASGIVTFDHPQGQQLLGRLHAAGVRASVRNGKLRLAPSWYNMAEEVETAVGVVAELV
jgi:selenocysteine lyase/cysteine desulfurase